MNGSIYAKPTLPPIIVRPLLATLFLHGLLVFLMTLNWDYSEREVVRIKPAPKAITARLVDISDFQPKPKPKPKVVSKPKPKPKVVAKPKPKPKATVKAAKPKVVKAKTAKPKTAKPKVKKVAAK